MNITVVGAGAVGGYFGGRLAEAGANVTFLVREKRALQLEQTGLQIESPFGNVVLHPVIATDVTAIEHCDLILLSVKNYHLSSVLETICPLIQKGAKVLPLLNGVEHFEMLQHAFGKDTVLGGLCHIIATLDQDGKIIHTNQIHSMTFGPIEPQQTTFCQEFYALAKKANFDISFKENIWHSIWHKYVFITAFSGITTASRLSIDGVVGCDATRCVLQRSLEEMCSLAAKYGGQQAEDYVTKTLLMLEKMAEGTTSSMHQDFRKGLELEVESLQGAAVRLAHKASLQVPVIETLYGLIKPFEKGNCC
ncbi:ketopantoate reductase family protein [Fodinisporobacter ferrooxydans]|uniref:2-dehydropantoate 2-reductase n=1 Tax=Fodinisporobacter ferrooxydans TaxID=2901836 RepID=A0ABY4CNM6_9BACL|nr:ketopantoate reductase family protein [Alicyclobacillaceae bacterium MYW30-H2]